MFDIHCHILFDVDDGSKSLKESAAMLVEARKSGISTVVCTPHARGHWWCPDKVQENFQKLKSVAEPEGMTLDLGYEVHWKKLAELGMDWAPKLTIGETNLMLLEFSNDSMPANWQGMIKKLRGMGLVPIIAHPERYRAVQRDLDIAYELKDLGCYLQLSGNFVEDRKFGDCNRTALNLLKQGLVDYVASDAHCPEDYASYRKALAIAKKY